MEYKCLKCSTPVTGLHYYYIFGHCEPCYRAAMLAGVQHALAEAFPSDSTILQAQPYLGT